MYAELETKLRWVVDQARRQVPGYTGRIPVRFAPVDKSIVVRHAEEGQHDTLCPTCRTSLFPFTRVQVATEMAWRERVRADAIRNGAEPPTEHPMGARLVRERNGPWHHQRCWPVGGELLRYVPVSVLNRWLQQAGGTYAKKPPTSRNQETGRLCDLEFDVSDLDPALTRLFAATNRGTLWTPDGRATA